MCRIEFPVRIHLAVWRAVFEGQRQKNAWCWGVDTPLVPVEELQNLLKFAMEKADQPVTMLCHNGKEESLIAVYDARLYKEITDFLASDASDYLNGAIIPVDGGYLVK